MNMIYEWAKMLSESNEDLTPVEEMEGGRIGISRPDELGKNINGIISKDIFERKDGDLKDLFDADFKCNISDTGTLIQKFPEIPKDKLPTNSSFIYFMCAHLALDPKRMVDYINSECAEVLPEPLNADDVIYLGSYDVKQKDGERQDLFVIQNGQYSGANAVEKKRKEVNDAFSTIRDGYTDESLMVKYGDKEYLTKYLKQNQSALNKLQDKQNYLLMIALKDTFRPSKRIKVANAIGAATDIFGDSEIEDKDIEKLGVIRGKYKATGSIFELDAFIIKAN